MITCIARHRSAHHAFYQSVNAKLTVPCAGLIGIDFILLFSRDLLSAITPQSACGIVALFDCRRASN
jgi:hypothetical protein